MVIETMAVALFAGCFGFACGLFFGANQTIETNELEPRQQAAQVARLQSDNLALLHACENQQAIIERQGRQILNLNARIRR